MLGIKHPPMVVHCRPANSIMRKTAPNQSEHLAHYAVQPAPPLKAEVAVARAKSEQKKAPNGSHTFPFLICDSKPFTALQSVLNEIKA